ncbi:MAG: tautomerase family protein [Clostridia bacterium]|nr:tautomerase family protein [Clostridia bacterium]
MPLIRIEMKKGKSPEYRQKLLDCVHSGIMEALGTADWDRFQRIIEIPEENFETSPSKSDDFMIIELTLFPGRTKELKAKAIEFITGNLNKELGIRPEDVFIVIHEPPFENWGMAGKQLTE